MDTVQHQPTEVAALGSLLQWHFRALPRDVQQRIIRRLALSGLSHDQIAARTGLSVETIRRAVSEDDCLRYLPTLATSHSLWSRTTPSASSAN